MAKKSKGAVKATQAAVNFTTEKGSKVLKGQWLVVEGDEESVWSDAEFRAEFAPASSSTALATTRFGDRCDHPSALVRPGRSAAADGLTPVPSSRSMGPGYEITAEGRGKIPGLAAIVGGSLSPNVMLPALKITNTETGEIMLRPALDVQADMRPKITAIKTDGDGNVVGMDIQPEEWPPRQERF